MFNLFLAVYPEIFIINATSILLIHGVVFSTSKKYDYPPLVSNVGWLGLLSVARLGGQRALGCKGDQRKLDWLERICCYLATRRPFCPISSAFSHIFCQ